MKNCFKNLYIIKMLKKINKYLRNHLNSQVIIKY